MLGKASAADIAKRRDALLGRLRAAAEAAGRDPDGFRIVAVTKTFPTVVCRAAFDAGLTALAENRVQEALPKIAALPEAEWHLVGHLQSNKVRRAVASFATIHSVDSVDLLRRIDAAAHDLVRRPRLLLQVNVSGEPMKSGFAPPTVLQPDTVDALAGTQNVDVVGLMTIGPQHADPRPGFAGLRRLRDGLQEKLGRPLPELSMGMSADAEAGVAEGATLVRIGTALFGPRPG
ncbi:MAG TPA: YggS family pyridoxal phosphate-dependent enzyme [Candidatus Limnocylindria bacterium]|nr:YggS family pyridoxal phosphate-dependent enzyme [Candidatus Limnocylindria bacterium]